MKPIAVFRVRPAPKARLYYTVKIFHTLRAMRTYCVCEHPSEGLARVFGLCSTWHAPTRRAPNEVGEIILAQDHLDAGTVSHECTHAMFGYCMRRALNPAGNGIAAGDEEIAATSVGDMVRQIYRYCFRTGLLSVWRLGR